MRKPNKKHQRANRASTQDLFQNEVRGKGLFPLVDSEKQLSYGKKLEPKLLSIEELQHLFNRFNHLYFDGKLGKVQIEYSNRMTCAGSYCLDDHLISISRKYHLIFPNEIEDTLKHEMIHLKHFYHNSAFKREAERIGASLKAKTHPSLQRPPKFLYVCPGCGLEYPRQKKMHMYSCYDCSANKKYDPRFKLKLVRTVRLACKPT